MRNLRPVAGVLFSASLCLTLVLATVSSAIAHVQMATGQVVDICAGADTITLTLDAQGNPINPPHHCPDCSALTAAPPEGAAPDLARPVGRSAPQVCAMVLPETVDLPPVPPARGPPGLT